MKTAVVALLISASLHFACFAKWPGDPDWDVHHSVFAAQNLVRQGRLESINLFPVRDDNLARHAQLTWMTNWPPVHSLLFAAIMQFGISPGAATKMLAFFCVLLGGLGWMFLARHLGGAALCVALVAAAYPWLSFMGRIYLDYKNDHLACALAPWVYISVMRIESLNRCTNERWGRLLLAALIAGITVVVKYSLIPLLVASGLYLLWLDGRILTFKRLFRVGVFFAILVFPGLILWLVNQAWGEKSYPLQPGGGLSISLPVFAENIISHTFGAAAGWELIFIQLNLALGRWFGIHLFRGTVFFASSLLLLIWIFHFSRSRWDTKEKSFGIYLFLSTVSLCVMLAVMTLFSGIKYDFSSDGRFSMPIAFGWLVLGSVSLGKLSKRSMVRSAALYFLVIPMVFSGVFFAATGLFKEPYLRMPNTRIMWNESYDASHPGFLSHLVAERGKKPDLLVAPDARFMTELGVPCFFTFIATADDHDVYYSSVDLEVLAIVFPADQTILLQKFSKASRSERIDTPPGFPYVVYILDFFVPNPRPVSARSALDSGPRSEPVLPI
jgi:hypothetical protein